MKTDDVILFVGLIVTLWCAGFTAGYLLTQFKNAMMKIV